MEHDYVENIRKTNDYRIVWVDKDYDIREIFIEAESKKKALIEFFTEETEVDAFGVENFKIKRM